MIIKANDRIFVQTLNVLEVVDNPDKDAVSIFFKTSTQLRTASSTFNGQDRLDILAAFEKASYDTRS